MKFSCNRRLQAGSSCSMTAIDAAVRFDSCKATKTIAYNPYVQQHRVDHHQSKNDKNQQLRRQQCQSKQDCQSRCSDLKTSRSPMDPASQTYFHGLLTPELAEERLLMLATAGSSASYGAEDSNYEKPDGAFLLRSCPDGDFVVSVLCRQDSSVTHYQIVRCSSTGYRLVGDGSSFNGTFPGPVELLRGHPTLVKLARLPCPRPSGTSPLALAQGITTDELARLSRVSSFASSTGTEDMNAGQSIDQLLLVNLHRDRPWYHEDCRDRDDAERRLASGGHASGDFLVRCRSAGHSSSSTQRPEFVLTLSWRREAWHYRIFSWRSRPDWLAIEGADRGFPTLIQLIDHYHLRRDGLMCRLRRAVPANAAVAAAEAAAELAKAESEVATDWEFLSGIETKKRRPSSANPDRASQPPAPDANPADQPVQLRHGRSANRHSAAPLQTAPNFAPARRRTLLDDIVNDAAAAVVEVGILRDDRGDIQIRQMRLVEKLGAGQFGEVWRATVAVHNSQDQGVDLCPQQQQSLSLAARVLPASTAASSLVSAAVRSVEGLQHPNLLRLLGSVESQGVECGGAGPRQRLLLMEWASLGPADRHLRRHPECPTEHLLNLSHQVSQAMAYLESRGLAHRCLSARNVLLFPIWRAKISGDFGLFDGNEWNESAIGADTDGRRHLAARPHLWHAPEALQHSRFTCRSDVWSFGVTCWELLHRGRCLPFVSRQPADNRLSPRQLLNRLRDGERLTAPPECSAELADLLLDCWRWAPEDRPAFASIERVLAGMTHPSAANNPRPRSELTADVEEAGELSYCLV